MGWGNVDNSSNAVTYAVTGFNKTANSDNITNFFGNTTPGAFVSGMTVGQFGIDVTEVGVSNGSVSAYTVTNPGSGYFSVPTVTVSGNATANATVSATGTISSVNIVDAGSGYITSPTVTIDPPSVSFNANTAVTVATDFIALSSNVLQNGDRVTYLVATGNTALSPLTNNTPYFVTSANSTGIKLSLTPSGAALDITAKGLSETGHTLVGQTATANAVVSGLKNKGLHAGWNIRKVGTGGRAGRVTYETLVAMGSLSSDASDDTIAKDA